MKVFGLVKFVHIIATQTDRCALGSYISRTTTVRFEKFGNYPLSPTQNRFRLIVQRFGARRSANLM